MASREWLAAFVLVFGALVLARLLSSWGQSGRWAPRSARRGGLHRKAHHG